MPDQETINAIWAFGAGAVIMLLVWICVVLAYSGTRRR